MMAAKAPTRRVFFALWPDDSARQQIIHAFRQSVFASQPGRPVSAENLHLTLHYMGQLALPLIEELKQAAAQIKPAEFSLSLDHFGSFPAAGVLWLGSSQHPESLAGLHQALARQLLAAAIQPERRAFQPHITLLRHYRHTITEEASLLERPFSWVVKRFALLESVSSEQGVVYRPLAVYPLLSE